MTSILLKISFIPVSTCEDTYFHDYFNYLDINKEIENLGDYVYNDFENLQTNIKKTFNNLLKENS